MANSLVEWVKLDCEVAKVDWSYGKSRPPTPRRPKLPAGKFRTGHGYVMVWTEPRFPGSRPYGKGWAILEHHKVMGEMIGRALLPGESVRHDNHVRDDNSPENLVLMLEGRPAMKQFDRAREMVARYVGLFGTVNSHAA